MSSLFLLSILLIFHAYFGYPLTLVLLRSIKRQRVTKKTIEPTASLIITVCNEERRITEKLENTLKLDYPREKLQVLVASDGSTDKTNELVKNHAANGIQLLEFPERRGKEYAQKDAVAQSTGEIIIFSDVATLIDPQGIRQIIANFADPTVGCVSSTDKVLGRDGKPCGEGFYVRYEMWLRDLESQVNSLVGLSGSFFAARSEVCQDFSGEMQSDFRTVLNSRRLGLRGVSDPEAIGYYHDVADNKREFERKVRTVLRGLTVFFSNIEFLNPLRYGLFSYQYFCHKLLRWLVPVFLLLAFTVNAILSLNSVLFTNIFLIQLTFYIIAIYSIQRNFSSFISILKLPQYFLIVNLAIVLAWWQFFQGTRMVMWIPSKR